MSGDYAVWHLVRSRELHRAAEEYRLARQAGNSGAGVRSGSGRRSRKGWNVGGISRLVRRPESVGSGVGPGPGGVTAAAGPVRPGRRPVAVADPQVIPGTAAGRQRS
ncbi:hypothetical protein AB0G74_14375 [Streptomyces sp. NPDC020875]|uniref:hypothetical protein n=1 Tax=Streptomyces sp. NPDC020875 TaxID=3154898 RepID=UPI00340B7C5B